MKQKVIIGIALAAAAIVVAFILLYDPTHRPVAPMAGPQATPVPTQVGPGPTPTPVGSPPRAKTVPLEPPPPDAGTVKDAQPSDAMPEGPFEFNLGRHKIHLSDPEQGRVLRIGLKVVTPHWRTRKEIARRRMELVRLLFFLGSHRRGDGAVGEEGKARFQADLHERFNNIIKTGPVDEVLFYEYDVGQP